MDAFRTKRRPRRITAGAVFAVVTVLLAACSAPAGREPPDAPAVTLPGGERPQLPAPSTRPTRPAAPGSVTSAPKSNANQVQAAFAGRDLMKHLEALQKVAETAGGNRASGTSGYDASASYVEEQLRAAGYK